MRLLAASAALALAAHAGAAEPDAPPRLRIEVAGPARAGAQIPVRILVLDARGQPDDVAVSLDADGGQVSAPRRLARGHWEAALTVPARLPPVRSLLLLARTDAAHAELAVPLLPGPAATAVLDGVDSCAEGAESCPLVLRVLDEAGNGADERPEVRTQRGRIVSMSAPEPGRWVLAYRAPSLEREERDRVTAEVGKLTAAHEVLLQPSRSRLALVLRAGAASQDSHLGPAAGGQLFAVGSAGGWLLGGGLEGQWWRVSHTGSTDTGGGTLDLKDERSELVVGVCGVAERALGRHTVLWLSAMAGGARVESRTQLTGQPWVTASAWALAAGGGAALGWRTRAGIPFLELRADWTGDPQLATVSGASTAILASAGWRFDAR